MLQTRTRAIAIRDALLTRYGGASDTLTTTTRVFIRGWDDGYIYTEIEPRPSVKILGDGGEAISNSYLSGYVDRYELKISRSIPQSQFNQGEIDLILIDQEGDLDEETLVAEGKLCQVENIDPVTERQLDWTVRVIWKKGEQQLNPRG